VSEFGHLVQIDQIRDGDRLDIVATDEERAALAGRLGLESLERLEAHAILSREGQRIRVTGRLKAALHQSCVATGEPVPAHVDEPFDILFIPEPTVRGDEEIELAVGDLDTVFHDGSLLDLGSAVADTLALALDPYPRSAGADAALREAGVLTEEEASPFAALAALKGKMGK